MRLDENKGIFTIPEFGKIQLEGFDRFIEQGLIEELNKFSKIESPKKKRKFLLFGNEYKLTEPSIKERDAVYMSLTYHCQLYVPARLIKKTKTREKIKNRMILYLGDIPLMNSKGTFVINGNYRVVVNQILRSPGIYYTWERKPSGNIIYIGTIISDWGGRSRLEIKKKTKKIWIRVSRKKKISVLLFLLAMGLNSKDIFNYKNILAFFKYSEEYYTYFYWYGGKEEAILELYKELYISDEIEKENCEFSDIYEKVRAFFRMKCALGKNGRRNPNKKLSLDIPENEIFSLPHDVLAAVDYLIKVRFGTGTPDDIDHLQNRYIRSVADLLQEQLRFALIDFREAIEKTILSASTNPKKRITNKLETLIPLTETFQDFFGLHPLSQFLDQTNPLAEIVHSRKVSSLGPGGLTSRTSTFRTRDIHPSHYGRICPITTSEGINVGLIGSLSIYATLGHYGSLQSPFYRLSERSNEEQMVYLLPGEDEYYRIATGNSLALNQGVPEEQFTPARFQQEFLFFAWDQIHFRSIFPSQYFSVGVCLIPFIEHNDANRALMGSNMQRQAVPLVQPEKCIVGTGLEGQAALDSGSVAIAKQGGKIKYIDGENITITSSVARNNIETELILYQRSNSDTCMHQKPRVRQGEYVKRGQIIADSAATAGGELSLGKNILVAYMPWEGYNFEDAILISERLVYQDIFTSFQIVRYEIGVYFTNQGPEVITREIPHLDAYLLRHLDENGLVMIGSWIETGDVLVGKLILEAEEDSLLNTPEGKLLQALFDIKAPTGKENCFRVPKGVKGRVIDVRCFQEFEEDDYLGDIVEKVHVYILQKRKIQVGDKVAGRHGNKGIISKILPRQDMPYLQNGTPVDMVLNPLGVPSRMNVGQIFECLLGLAGKLMNKHYRLAPFDERYEREASRKLVFSELYKASEQTANPWVFEPDHPGKHRLIDGRTGKVFEQPVTIGIAYISKLCHQVDDKIHARSSGPYTLVTQQPLKGKSHRGGQRVGEMEVWALQGFGVAYILHEMLTLKSDHMDTREKIFGAIFNGEPMPKPSTPTESFRLLSRELRSLALELNHTILSEIDFQIDKKEV
ncbi:RNA polymerase beta subunit (chloroplast) [Cryptomeria japonica]|uniref:DNA-directed RNA polymerase subunit beta n=2 Tax=Cryptomeria japonica TaxID=3369 RepID=B1VKH3_CRYJA|nr:RNA polymerase beta subunit [Cryptomeria japonica]QLF68035.1 RNA polymerase beta subunit [Cryptomeria japonica var. sinensis]UFA48260.1 RNA polymerase beta subunit [Cryptomeria japonica var. sinensis]UFA48342.1 RNA polymerase beta subunit [Cryptomeria japonica var. sinensis]UFA48424.1 RNA polymerase beta subunit [Cryptomeria japonica var. sinensis]UFA48507.1 RNA polymerase beta subunit [Cryptomeria japonica var. sinensis]